MLMKKLVLVARAHQQPTKTLNQWMILVNQRTNIREVADDIEISFGTSQEISTNVLAWKCGSLDCSKIAKFRAKQSRMDIAQEMLRTFNDYPDLPKKVITNDESWVYGYDIETKTQSST